MISFRGLAVVVVAVVVISLLALPLLQALDVWIVHNPRPAHPLHLLFVWFVGAVVFWIFSPIFSLGPFLAFAGVIGGASANLSYRIFIGPVPDYIPLPAGAYGNLADLLIIGGVLVFWLWVGLRIILHMKSEKTLAIRFGVFGEK